MGKFVDSSAIMQVIGTVYNNPQLLDLTDKYKITSQDFPDIFHRTVFGSMHALYGLGVNQFSLENIADFLRERPKSQSTYLNNKGEEYIIKVSEYANLESFDYYYNRMKKMSLLRAYDAIGVDVTDIYDPDNFSDIKKKEEQEEYIDNSSLLQISDAVKARIEAVELSYVHEVKSVTRQIGEGLESLVEGFKDSPAWGIPLYGDVNTTICRGARLGKVYCVTASTGAGKTRMLISQGCMFGCNELYDTEKRQWVSNGKSHPTSIIVTEQDLEEVQTLAVAFISGVDEDHIIDFNYEDGELERVRKAIKILNDSPIYIDELPTFSLSDLENTLKKVVREKGVQYVVFDYVQSKIEIFSEISALVGKMPLREDQMLLLQMTKLKDIAMKYGLFLYTATQSNGDLKDTKVYDQNVIRGSKAIADKIDVGSVLTKVKPDDITALSPILSTGIFPEPNTKQVYYKNRRGKYVDVTVWCLSELGTCRVTPLFVTDYSFRMVDIENTKVLVMDKSTSPPWEED